MVRADTLVLFLIFEGILSVFSPLRIMFAVGFSYMAFTSWGRFLLCPFWSIFIINGCWTLLKAFSASIEMITWFLSFNLLIMVYHADWFVYIEESLYPWNKPDLNMVYELFNVLFILFARILLRIFASMFISDIDWYWPVTNYMDFYVILTPALWNIVIRFIYKRTDHKAGKLTWLPFLCL